MICFISDLTIIFACQMTRVKTQNEHLVTECQQFKDLMWAKDKAVEVSYLFNFIFCFYSHKNRISQ